MTEDNDEIRARAKKKAAVRIGNMIGNNVQETIGAMFQDYAKNNPEKVKFMFDKFMNLIFDVMTEL